MDKTKLMDSQIDLKQVFDKLNRIEQLLIDLSQKKKNTKTWVKATEVMKFTGWDKGYMKKAREYGFVEWKKDKKLGFLYLLESIHPLLIRKKIS